MAISPLSTAVHTAGVALFGYSLYYYVLYVKIPAALIAENKNFQAAAAWPGKWKYLTVWNIVIQLVYYAVALLNDLVGSAELNKSRQTFLQKLRDAYFASWVFPTGMLVSISFWTLFSIDRKLIFPVEMEIFYPAALNHAVHTCPILFLAIDSYFCPKLYPSRAIGCFANVIFAATYCGWIIWVNSVSNVWPYPVLAILGPTQRTMFKIGAGVVILLFYFLGEALNKWRWGTDIAVSEKRKKKK